ncbi:MAG: helix-turn-helix domain-containing protein [Verrucomicrobia bacterium]|nr:helix-turn-helix domain-containing protein [Verrucomicrobiota bacterium]MCF7708607.1 helix-turn-helix domain-containing protein [Verrucomicrobiota bacterium]
MTEKTKDYYKDALRKFRDNRGGVPDALKKYSSNYRKARKQIIESLKESCLTIPSIAETTGLEKHVVMWHIAGLRKYGLVEEAGNEGDYVKYVLIRSNDESH